LVAFAEGMMAIAAKDLEQLRQLALAEGIQHGYQDVAGQHQEASAQGLLRALQVFGIPIERPEEAGHWLRQRRLAHWQEAIEPVLVAWEGRLAIPVRLAETALAGVYLGRLTLESGEDRPFAGRLDDLPTRRMLRLDGISYVVKTLAIHGRVPWGYHRLHCELPGQVVEAMVIAAPRKAYPGEPGDPSHLWGVFLPLYALHRQSSWGAGDFSDLAALMEWTAEQGGNLVATLPLQASMRLTEDPSPYSPSSRLFWNEFYLDVTRIPELAHSPKAQQLLAHPAIRRQLDSLRSEPLVNYRELMGIKRGVIEALAESFFARDGQRRAALERYRREQPQVESYARFRAAAERHGTDWTRWPEPMRNGRIERNRYDEAVFRYHLYAQWQTEEQLQAATSHARQSNLLWYLDFPLGVSRDGYDVWSEREVFALEASGGAPPDAFFTKGQNWGFPPLHPDRLRRQWYRYLIDAMRGQMRHAKILRFDHIMGLYRLYWVPFGLSAKEGVYVHYPMDELMAILSLESHRFKARVVGENLGTVPPEVDTGMTRHGIGDMYVVQYELKMDPAQPLRPIRPSSVASLNTHDMPTFTAFYRAMDAEERLDLELLSPEEAEEVRRSRAEQCRLLAEFLRREGLLDATLDDTAAVTEACLTYLGQSPASVVLLNLEDLWGETQPQNTPGTFTERPNWRRKTHWSFDDFRQMPEVLRVIRRVAESRKQAAKAAADEDARKNHQT
jgi:4-alpha-glucanotransferase